MKLSEKSIDFIKQYVLPKLGYEEIDFEDLGEIVDFIIDEYEVPLSQAKEAGEKIDENLLELAASVVTEITTNPEW